MKISGIRIIGMNLTVFCKCGAKMTVQGTPAGVQAAVKAWSVDHRGEGQGAFCAYFSVKVSMHYNQYYSV